MKAKRTLWTLFSALALVFAAHAGSEKSAAAETKAGVQEGGAKASAKEAKEKSPGFFELLARGFDASPQPTQEGSTDVHSAAWGHSHYEE